MPTIYLILAIYGKEDPFFEDVRAIVPVCNVSHYVIVLVRIVVEESIIVVETINTVDIDGIVVAINVRIGNVVVTRRIIVIVSVLVLRIMYYGYLLDLWIAYIIVRNLVDVVLIDIDWAVRN